MADEEDLEDEDDEDFDDEDGDEDDESSDKPGGKKKLIIIAVVLLLAIGGIAAAYFTGLLQPIIELITGEEATKEEEKEVDKENAVFFPLEELIVNLNAGGRKSTFLKIRISLELADGEDISRIESVMPRIMDNFQVYLRELRIEDLKGSAGMYRLREELLTRVNAAAAPAKIRCGILYQYHRHWYLVRPPITL